MLVAQLKHVTGSARHAALMVGRGGVVALPDPSSLRILRDGAGYALQRLDAAGVSVVDTWHPSLEAAIARAAADYGVAEADWEHR
jgi:hypothetical protein